MRETTHYIGDECPGSHADLLPAPSAEPAGITPAEAITLLGQVSTAIHQTEGGLWAARGQLVQHLLHEAGIHTGQLGPLGAPVRTDWRDCPKCSMHPERHTGEQS